MFLQRSLLTFIALLILPCASVYADEVDVLDVSVRSQGPGIYRFNVTVKHGDMGWDHYADKWEIVAPNGTVLGTRVLAHPHVNEQPFTRSLSGVKIPNGIASVTIRAHDSVHGYGGTTVQVDIPH